MLVIAAIHAKCSKHHVECHEKLSKVAVIWTHDRDVRAMGLFSILRHKLLLQNYFENGNST